VVIEGKEKTRGKRSVNRIDAQKQLSNVMRPSASWQTVEGGGRTESAQTPGEGKKRGGGRYTKKCQGDPTTERIIAWVWRKRSKPKRKEGKGDRRGRGVEKGGKRATLLGSD